jgi:hypothetical protein
VFFLFSAASRQSLGSTYPMGTEGREFLQQHSGRGVELTAHLHLIPMSRMVELYLHYPICLRCVVLN